MNRIKLLVDAHVFDEAPQGTMTYIREIYREIISTQDPGIEIFLCAQNTERLQAAFGEQVNVTYVKLKAKNKFSRLLFEFPRLIRKYDIDFAHFQYVVPLLKTCKEIVTIHDLLFLDYPGYFPIKYRISKSFLFKIAAKRADLLLTVSDFSRVAINKHFNIPLDQIDITPNGVSKHFFKAVAPTELTNFRNKYGLKKFLLYVSRIEPRKNQLILLRAFHELELWKHGYDLVFIGRTDIAAADFSSYLNELDEKVKEHVKIFEDISAGELILFYQSCELFVYPSLAEGFGIPPLEAAASGTTVLCSNRTAMSDFNFFQDAFFNPDDLAELKQKMLANLNKKDNESRVKKIQHDIETQYSWKRAAEILLEKVKEIGRSKN